MNDSLTDTNSRAVVLESLKRCNAMGDFLTQFYELFVSSSPEVGKLFAGTDMERQVSMLSGSLHYMIHAGDGSKVVESHIKELGSFHRDIGVPPAMYDLWLECLLDTVQACDPLTGPAVIEAWRSVMLDGIRRMKNAHPG